MKVFFLVLLVVPLFGQQVSVVATVDSPSVSLGDWIRLSVEVKHPAGQKIQFPALKDSLGSFEIVQQDSLMKKDENGESILSKKMIIAKYESGNFYVPPVVVTFMNAQGVADSASSNSIPVEVRGVEVDTTQAIRDVKAPISVPMSIEEIAVYIGAALVVAGAAYGIYFYIKKKKRTGMVVEDDTPEIPADVAALQKLEALESEHVWQSGEVKLFYSRATEIVREYFEKRYGIMALEMTTGEVMDQLEKFTIEKNVSGSIEQFLSNADLVKFAKHQPIASENEGIIPLAKVIVDKTKPAESKGESAALKEEAQKNG